MGLPRIEPVRWTPPPADDSDWPPPQTGPATTVSIPGSGPEDIVVDGDGNLWCGTDDGKIIKVTPDGEAAAIINTGGRPLGLHVAASGRILICDHDRGLLALDPQTRHLHKLVTEFEDKPLRFPSNVTETPNGTIYFTQSTRRHTLANYEADILEHSGTGRLYRYQRTEQDDRPQIAVLREGIQFANGVDHVDGRLVIAETGAYRVSVHDLGTGEYRPLIENLPGFPDNLSVAPDGQHVWVALVTPRNGLIDFFASRPPILRKALWPLMWASPDALLPVPRDTIWGIKIALDSGRVVHQVRTTANGFGMSTGLVEHDGTLWFGGLHGSAVAKVPLDV